MGGIAGKLLMLGCTGTVLVVVVVLQVVDHGPTIATTSAGTGTGGSALASAAAPFAIEGSATEAISPGVRAPLDVRLTNPHDHPMAVADLRVSVQKVSAPHADDAHPCAAGDFTVDQGPTGRKVTVAPRSTSTLSSLGLARATFPQVRMLNRAANQDGCKGASLTLAYTATGTLDQ
jgi:hypothetical protein